MTALSTTTYNYVLKGSAVTLSTDGMKATITSGTAAALACRPSGKAYWEFYLDTSLSGTPRLGLASYNTAWSTTVQIGTQVYSLGYATTGAVTINNTTVASIAAYSTGQYVGVALDPVNKLVWFRVNGGIWNNSSTADPATGVEGISLSTITGAVYYPAFSAAASAGCTLLSTTADFQTAPPEGFAAYGEMTPAGYNGDAVARPLSIVGDFPTAGGHSVYTGNPVGLPPGSGRFWLPAGPYTSIKGTVQEEGTAIAGKQVFLYDSTTGELLDSDTSGADGSFEVAAMGRINVHVVALDPKYQALVFDQVIPT